MKAHVSDKKKKKVTELVKDLQSEPIIGIIDLTSLPSAQFQKIKHKLRKDFKVVVAKKSLIKIAIEKVKDSKKGIEKLDAYLENAMPAILFTKQDAFKVAKSLSKNKSSTAAKPGQIAPKDLNVPEGPTAFAPGPIIGELGAAGIKASIENGKVIIKEESTIVKKGEEITQSQADMLAKFGIEPMEIGLNITAIYQDGNIFDSEVLSIDDAEYLNRIKLAATEALNLAVFVVYPTKETVEILLQKAEREKLSIESKLPAEETLKEEPKTEEQPVEQKTEDKVEEKSTQDSDKEPEVKDEAPKTQGKEEDQKSEEKPLETKDQSGYSEDSAKKAEQLLDQLKQDNI
ncbi:50S ribosomal protein L10 [Candidatus Woesearchaeota archaeon]|jgi:large subunit ribosomal protein L10|nr:50S ribosomal protein L10 [Candidatus Woesearchaeota archaeon]MBT4835455.1 50S ribosomal protein L10 [Candidatus Woesearchaeota archaeon]MBT6734853.1 50S ribosomal protein L10 [Candidatus Woesearchaeota archaeon]MBT7169632.1 50S ribosomal protein L10 [Candidatus Woesearchaeota archaeon]MBT7474590.1 50S ribosomal protein L10 [Candidatus Woesearchaeota archaeon]